MDHRPVASLACLYSMAVAGSVFAQAPLSGNPILPGWYADPEAHVFANEYWIYPTYSAPYDRQTFMDAFSSRDLVAWTKHPRALDVADIRWAKRAPVGAVDRGEGRMVLPVLRR